MVHISSVQLCHFEVQTYFLEVMVSCFIQKITEMVFAIVFFFSALLAGVVGGILTILTWKILEARPRKQTRVEVDNGRETGEGRIGIVVQGSTKVEQEHDKRCC